MNQSNTMRRRHRIQESARAIGEHGGGCRGRRLAEERVLGQKQPPTAVYSQSDARHGSVTKRPARVAEAASGVSSQLADGQPPGR